MKFPIRFYCALGVSAAFRVILTKISNRSGNGVQWNKTDNKKNLSPFVTVRMRFLSVPHALNVFHVR